VDWTRERFTMDAGLSRAVRIAFVTWYKKGLIYRGPRLVNWCPQDESAISDLEVEHEETKGKLYFIKYPIEGTEGTYITVATTRPETMLGDTAVVVHPKDPRYKELIGRFAILPPLGRRLPIIADETVDRKFGTGAVKVTPAHDPTDYELGKKHKLQSINVMNPNATINENGGQYAGLDRYVARDRLVEDLQAKGLVERIEEHTLSLGHCQRCDAVIEPLVSTQWFVRTKPLAKKAIQAVRSGKIKIVPARFNKEYFRWMTDIRDWCISRQLWWGHRIPVWYCENGHETCETTDPTKCAVCGSTNIRQDEDVLDTWFSSGLWPFSTLGWPDKTPDLRYFYPTSVLETGYDIIFFWVARMIMMGLDLTRKPPFHTVYLHGLMRHVDGSKMSKSDYRIGDNPLDVIRDYSSDALRFFIITSSSPGADVRMNFDKVAEARNFGNKIWNAARFVISNLDASRTAGSDSPQELSLADRWIRSRANATIAKVTRLLKEWRFNDAGQELYHFLWDEFCDWYIEASKLALYGNDERVKDSARATLVHVLDQSMRLLHPMMPFVTEEIYQHLRQPGWEPALIVAGWPSAGKRDPRAEAQFSLLMEVVRTIRNARSEYGIEPGRRIPATIEAGSSASWLESQRATISSLARLDEPQLTIVRNLTETPQQALALHVPGVTTYLPLAGMLDVEKEKGRVMGEIESLRAQIARSEQLLNSEFAAKAPAPVVAKERDRLTSSNERMARLETRLAQLEGRLVETGQISGVQKHAEASRRSPITKKRKTVKPVITRSNVKAKTRKRRALK
jgi:valyl-tRNA synthetase